jgi:transcriptional antiterminator NusG
MNLRNKQGKRGWYVVQTASGHEKKVKGYIEKRIETMEVWDRIFTVAVPERPVVKVKSGKRVEKQEKEYPGYVLVDMVLDDQTWAAVREAPGVLGFVGGDRHTPPTISENEVRKILRKNAIIGDNRIGTKKDIDFNMGDFVEILAGPFEGLEGEVKEINEDKNPITVKLDVLVFGRSTPTEVPLDYIKVKEG